MSEKLFKLFSGDKKKAAVLAAGILGTVLLVLSAFIPVNGTAVNDDKAASESVTDYAKLTEARLTRVLESIDGAGKIRVMITYECGSESVYGENRASKAEEDEKTFVNSDESEFVLIDTGSSENGLLLYIREPRVKGVAVVCEGGASPQVKKAITDAVTALFGIGENRVSVAKMNKNPEE